MAAIVAQPMMQQQLGSVTSSVCSSNLVSNNCCDAKVRKLSANIAQLHQQQQALQKQPSFGICFDIDGVLARGTEPIPAAVEAFKKLVNQRGRLRFPVAFVTNSLNLNSDKAAALSAMLEVKVTADQLVQAQGPLEVFSALHDKFCLLVGQGKLFDIAEELGFKNVCTVEQIAAAYPLLDVVDHDNRRRIAREGYIEKDFPKVEAVILMGEPKRWESSLQLLIDVLRCDGRPNQPPSRSAPHKQIPVVACNMDLQFQHAAPMPRYGHGAFLTCLEALYQKVTGRDLQYTALIGKPSEITYRYAEHVLTSQSRKLGFTEPITKMYFIGDTPDSDIVGSNLYQRHVDRLGARRRHNAAIHDGNVEKSIKELSIAASADQDPDLPSSRNVPTDACFHRQTVETVESLLVLTGVYRPPPPRRSSTASGHGRLTSEASADSGAGEMSSESENDYELDDEAVEPEEVAYHGHRDFPNNAELRKPSRICDDVKDAIEYILRKESFESV
jgi:HAD superfamily hydrolase (TIGR01456 family)